jgi:hypothetical protein
VNKSEVGGACCEALRGAARRCEALRGPGIQVLGVPWCCRTRPLALKPLHLACLGQGRARGGGDKPKKQRKRKQGEGRFKPKGGGRKNKTRKRRTSAPARKKKYVRTFFLVRFWAFLGKGSSKTREKKLSACQKKSPGKYFFGGGIFFWVIFFNSFSFRFFCCVG